MSQSENLNLSLNDAQLDLLVEAVEILRIYQQGFPDEEGRIKLGHARRLEQRLRRRRERRQSRR